MDSTFKQGRHERYAKLKEVVIKHIAHLKRKYLKFNKLSKEHDVPRKESKEMFFGNYKNSKIIDGSEEINEAFCNVFQEDTRTDETSSFTVLIV
jgi:hypothetical protein